MRKVCEMPRKPTKTRAELEVLFMTELRKHPACRVVGAIAISPGVGRLWHVALERDGSCIQPECRHRIWEITETLCSQFDLARAS
jgi:hypothetical protein